MEQDASAALDTFPKWLAHQARVRPQRPGMRHKDLGIWTEWSWAEVAQNVRAYALGLMAHGSRAATRSRSSGTIGPGSIGR